jgi:signal transduction histidine kinase
MSTMINGIIDVMRMEDGVMPVALSHADLGGIIRDAIAQYQGAAAKRGLSIGYAGPERMILSTDASILRRVLDNLIVNALKHTPAGGTVRILARFDAPAEAVAIQVADSGEGIDAGKLDVLFEKYGRIANQAMGSGHDTGLGLHFCRMAVELIGGRIAVASSLGQGTIFTITLPAPPAGLDGQQG